MGWCEAQAEPHAGASIAPRRATKHVRRGAGGGDGRRAWLGRGAPSARASGSSLLLARLTLARPSVSSTIWMRPQSPLCCAFSAVRIACAPVRAAAHAARACRARSVARLAAPRAPLRAFSDEAVQRPGAAGVGRCLLQGSSLLPGNHVGGIGRSVLDIGLQRVAAQGGARAIEMPCASGEPPPHGSASRRRRAIAIDLLGGSSTSARSP